VRLGTAAPLPLLRIGILNSFATTMGPYIFKRLRNIAAEWSIDSGFHATRMRAVIDRDFDLAITADESQASDEIEVRPILTEPFLLIVPSAYKSGDISLKALASDLELIRFGRDPLLHSRLDRFLEKHGVVAQHRYHLDTTEGVLAMVGMGSGWAVLSPLAVVKSLTRGDPIRALPFPGKPLYRTTNIVSLKNDGQAIATQMHAASAVALNEHFLPQVKRLMPKCLPMITVHEVRSSHRPPARNHDRRTRGP
jgi:DNA-binding transcriptional LysR family regulator